MNIRKFVLLFFISVQCSYASATIFTGDAFLERYREGSTYEAMLNYYISGLYDAFELTMGLGECLGGSVSSSAMKDSVVNYLEGNPRVRSNPMWATFLVAVNEEWDCGIPLKVIMELEKRSY